MFYTTAAALVVASAVLTKAQSAGQEAYLQSVCLPRDSSGNPDLDVPCNAAAAIEGQCMFGPDYIDYFMTDMSGSNRRRAAQQSPDVQNGNDDGPTLQSNETQRVCICESQFWDQLAGCFACYRGHGSLELDGTIPESVLSSASSTYCAASATASVGFAEFIYDMAIGAVPTATTTATGTASTSIKFADPIGNKTEVSYYWTHAITGTEAWSIPTGTSGFASYTTTNIQDGQIRPTASTSDAAATTTGGADATEPGNAAGRYEAAGAGGLIGLAGLVALL